MRLLLVAILEIQTVGLLSVTELLNWSQVKHLKMFNLHFYITSYYKVIFTATYAYFFKPNISKIYKKNTFLMNFVIYINPVKWLYYSAG